MKLKHNQETPFARIALGLEYDGSLFAGWQSQPNRRTIQTTVEHAVSKVADEPISVCSAGRTDAGVHAVEQIVHFDTHAARAVHSWVMGGNANLPDDIRILWAKQVDTGFHSRYSAIARYYRYVILNRPAQSALLRGRVTWCHTTLNSQRMLEAAQHLIGEHDFSSFRAKNCQSKSPFRRMYHIDVKAHREFVLIDVIANAFLHHMVRNIVGVLIEVGTGKKCPGWARKVLIAKKRTAGGATAQANGLYLVAVKYPDSLGPMNHAIFDYLPDFTKRYD